MCALPARTRFATVRREQAVKQTSTVLAVRHAYDLLTGFCEACPRRDGSARPVYYEI